MFMKVINAIADETLSTDYFHRRKKKNTLSQVQASDSTKNHIHGEIQKKTQ